MRRLASFAAVGLLVAAACTPFGGSAATSPSPHRASPSPVPSPTPTPGPSPTPFPSPPSELFVQINQSDYGFLTAQTVPGARCNGTATLPTGRAVGLRNPQIADAAGIVGWQYSNPPANDPGNGVHTVSCVYNGLTGTASAYFTEGN